MGDIPSITKSITMRKPLLIYNIIVLLLLWFFYFTAPIFSGSHSKIAFKGKNLTLFLLKPEQINCWIKSTHSFQNNEKKGNIMPFYQVNASFFLSFLFFLFFFSITDFQTEFECKALNLASAVFNEDHMLLHAWKKWLSSSLHAQCILFFHAASSSSILWDTETAWEMGNAIDSQRNHYEQRNSKPPGR